MSNNLYQNVQIRKRHREPILGKYADISMEEFMALTSLDPLYKDLLEVIYKANNAKIPLDILADMLEMIPYDHFARTYVDINNYIRFGTIYEYSKEILDYKFSENLKDQMVKYSVVPFQISEFDFLFLSPNTSIPAHETAEFKLFVNTVVSEFNANDRSVKVVRGTNKLLMLGLHHLVNGREYTIDNINITDKEELTKIFLDAISQKATDIYWDPKKDGIEINFSIYNDLRRYKKLVVTKGDREKLETAMLAMAGQTADNIDWTIIPTRDFSIKNLAGIDHYTGRLQCMRSDYGLSVVMRIRDTSKTAMDLTTLNASEDRKQDIQQMILNPTGMVLVAGETGSGKSTTISAALETLKEIRPAARVEEISKPVEIEVEGISQISLDDQNRGINFEVVLEAETRRNAKILFLGEINDEKSAKFAIDSAVSSKLLISTVHTSKVPLLFNRVRGITINNPSQYIDFLEVVVGLVHQVMHKEICPRCRKEALVESLGSIGPKYPQILKAYGYHKDTCFVTGKDPDCPVCNGLGYLIDKPIITMETLIITDDLREKIRARMDAPTLFLEEHLLKHQQSGIYDAFRYMAEGRLAADTVYERYALWNTSDEIINSVNR